MRNNELKAIGTKKFSWIWSEITKFLTAYATFLAVHMFTITLSTPFRKLSSLENIAGRNQSKCAFTNAVRLVTA